MTADLDELGRGSAEGVRRALIDAALAAYDDAGLRGLCVEGRWEAAVDAMRSADLGAPRTSTTELSSDFSAGLALAAAAVGRPVAPPPSGGSVAAAAGALAAALAQMVAGLTAGRPKYVDVATEMRDAARRAGALAAELQTLTAHDAAAVAAVAAAYRLPKSTEEAAAARADAIERAMRQATEAPLEIARAAAAVAELAAQVAERGNRNAVADAAVAAVLADSVCRAGALTVHVNVPALRDRSAGQRLEEVALGFVKGSSEAAARAVAVARLEANRQAR